MSARQRLFPSRGWQTPLIVTIAGAIGALAMQPFALWPALFVALTPPVLALDGLYASRADLTARQYLKRAALLGWLWGFGYFTAGLWWLGKAFLVDPEFIWAMPLGVLGLPSVLALFTAVAFVLAALLWSRHWPRILIFAAALTITEYLRGHLFTGFPWNTLGMALGNHLVFMQAASVFGLYGLTLLATLIGAAPASLFGGKARRNWFLPGFAVLLLAALATYGFMRLPAGPQPTVIDVRLRILQPNVQQDENFNAANGESILENYLALSQKDLPAARPTHYIWPESAFPFLLHRTNDALERIGTMLKPDNAALITGAARMDVPLPGEEAGTFFNSIQVVDSEGVIHDTYDKIHLVPFGEYVPDFAKAALQAVGLRQFVSYLPGGFTPGTARKPFHVNGLPPVAGVICYEAIFPGEIMPEGGGAGAGLILNVTNDAWFGNSPGPYQHLAQARLRAVEQGLPLIRAANSGISAVIDPYGRILQQSELDQAAVVDSELPLPLEEPTVFSRWQQAPFGALLALCIGVGLLGRWRQK